MLRRPRAAAAGGTAAVGILTRWRPAGERADTHNAGLPCSPHGNASNLAGWAKQEKETEKGLVPHHGLHPQKFAACKGGSPPSMVHMLLMYSNLQEGRPAFYPHNAG